MAAALKTYFRCEPLRCTLSTDACADSWRASQGADPRRWHCRGCITGAGHAGAAHAARLEPARPSVSCPRCGKEASKLIHGRVCVSCRNRELEVAQGRDRRGKRPQALSRFFSLATGRGIAQVHPVLMCLVTATGTEQARVSAATEVEAAVVATARRPEAVAVEPVMRLVLLGVATGSGVELAYLVAASSGDAAAMATAEPGAAIVEPVFSPQERPQQMRLW